VALLRRKRIEQMNVYAPAILFCFMELFSKRSNPTTILTKASHLANPPCMLHVLSLTSAFF